MKNFNKILALPLLASALFLSPLGNTALAENVQVNMGVTGGSLVLSVPTSATPLVLPSVSINQVIAANQSPNTVFHDFNVTDARGSGAGWRLQLSTQAFTDGTNTLIEDRTYVAGSSLPNHSGIWNNVQTKTTLVDGAAYTLLSAALDSGMGSYDFSNLTLGYDFLTADAKTLKAGAYTSQTTLAAVTGP